MGLASLAALEMIFNQPARAQDTTGYLYVTDYGRKNLERYQYTFDFATGKLLTGFTPAGNPIYAGTSDAAVLVSGNIKEGLQGTKTDLIIVQGDGSSVGRYTLDGVKIGDIRLSGFPPGKSSLQTVGNFAITKDGKYLYAPDEGAGYIYKVNLATGHIDHYVAYAGAHDVAIANDGTIFAAAYRGAQQIVTFDANLTAASQRVIVANVSHPTGLSLTPDGSGLYVNSLAPTSSASTTIKTGPDSVNYYRLSGSGNAITATLVPSNSITSSLLKFSFGNAIAPDGSVFTAELGNVFNAPSYTGGVYRVDPTAPAAPSGTVVKFDPTKGTMPNVTLAVAGSTTNRNGVVIGPYGDGGLSAPKYVQFNNNFIDAPDAGFIPDGFSVPEPGEVTGVVGLAVLGVGYMSQRRKARLKK